ncbi:MAG: hypothetical protein ACLU3U_04750 [Gallintestinimicrobium sp.]
MWHLLVRRASRDGRNLRSACNDNAAGTDLKAGKSDCFPPLNGKFAGILHITNDSMSDAVWRTAVKLCTAEDYFYEELLGPKFRISTFLLPDEHLRRRGAARQRGNMFAAW